MPDENHETQLPIRRRPRFGQERYRHPGTLDEAGPDFVARLEDVVGQLGEIFDSVNRLAEDGFAAIHVLQRATMYSQLAAGGVLNSWTVGPPSSNLFAVEGVVLSVPGDPGAQVQTTFTIPVPAAGADWTYTLPTEMEITSITTNLTTGATAGNRYPSILIRSGGQQVYQASAQAVGANVSATISYGPGLPSTSLDNEQTVPLPALTLPAGTIVQSITTNITAGDQYGPDTITGQVPTAQTTLQLGNPASGGLLLSPQSVGTTSWSLPSWIYNPQTDGPPVLTAGGVAGFYFAAFVGRQVSPRSLLR